MMVLQQQTDVSVDCGRRMEYQLTSQQRPTSDDKPGNVEDVRSTSTKQDDNISGDVTLMSENIKDLSDLVKNMALGTRTDISELIELVEDITIEPNQEKKSRDETGSVTDDNDVQVLPRGLGDNAFPTAAADPRQLMSMQAASLQGQQGEGRAVKCLRRSPAQAEQFDYAVLPPQNGGRSVQLPSSCMYTNRDVPTQRFDMQSVFGDCNGMLPYHEMFRRPSHCSSTHHQQQQQQHSCVTTCSAAPNIYTNSEVPFNFDPRNNIYSGVNVPGAYLPDGVFQFHVAGNGGLPNNDFQSVGIRPTMTPEFQHQAGLNNFCPVGPQSFASSRQGNRVHNGQQQFQQQQQQFPMNVTCFETATGSSVPDLPELNDSDLDILQCPPITCSGSGHPTQHHLTRHLTRSPVLTAPAAPTHFMPATQFFETSVAAVNNEYPLNSSLPDHSSGLNSTSGVTSASNVAQPFYQIPLYEGGADRRERQLSCSPLGQTSRFNGGTSTIRNSPQSTHQNFQATNCRANPVGFSSAECQLVSPMSQISPINSASAVSPHQFFQQTINGHDAVPSACRSPRQLTANNNNNYFKFQQQGPQFQGFLVPPSATFPATSSVHDLNRVRSQPNISQQSLPVVPSVRRVSCSSTAPPLNVNNYNHSPREDTCLSQESYSPRVPSSQATLITEQCQNMSSADQVDSSVVINELFQVLQQHDEHFIDSITADLYDQQQQQQQQQLEDGLQYSDVNSDDSSSLAAPSSVATVDSIRFNTDSSSPPSRPPPSISVTSDNSEELLKELDQYISQVPVDTNFPFPTTFGEINHVVSGEGRRSDPPSTLELEGAGNMSFNRWGGSQVSPSSSVCSNSTLSSYHSTADAVAVSPVEAAADDEKLKAVRRANLLSAADLLHQNPDGDSPLHMALIDGEECYATVLLQKYTQHNLVEDILEMHNNMQQTPLCLAVLTNQSTIVRQLLDCGADVTAQIRSDQRTGVKYDQPIHYAASKGAEWLETLRILLTSPHIHINALNSEGRSPLHCAVDSHGKTTSRQTKIDSSRTIELLVERGADLNLPDGSCERTPLHFAISRRDVCLVRQLLELALRRSSSASTTSRRGATGHGSLVLAMLSARTGTGNAALHLAVSLKLMAPSDQRGLVQLLLSKGADPSAKNADGQLPREMTSNVEIINLLKGQHPTIRRPANVR